MEQLTPTEETPAGTSPTGTPVDQALSNAIASLVGQSSHADPVVINRRLTICTTCKHFNGLACFKMPGCPRTWPGRFLHLVMGRGTRAGPTETHATALWGGTCPKGKWDIEASEANDETK